MEHIIELINLVNPLLNFLRLYDSIRDLNSPNGATVRQITQHLNGQFVHCNEEHVHIFLQVAVTRGRVEVVQGGHYRVLSRRERRAIRNALQNEDE